MMRKEMESWELMYDGNFEEEEAFVVIAWLVAYERDVRLIWFVMQDVRGGEKHIYVLRA